jgi:hypothetical protein
MAAMKYHDNERIRAAIWSHVELSAPNKPFQADAAEPRNWRATLAVKEI